MFKGVCTALITPFNANGVDFEGFGKLIEYQIENGIDALLVCGTTGEPATMTSEEKQAVIKFAIDKINHRVPVLVGTGANSTATAIKSSIEAEKMGADALLVVTPYYNKCTQDGLFEHYKAICTAVNIPVYCYNVPGRTGVNIMPATAKKLADLPNMIAIKEACGNVAQISSTANLIKDTKMQLVSGDDGLTLPIMALGGVGLISVASNVIPKEMANMVHAYIDGNIDKCRELQFKYADFIDMLFCEVNPIPCKKACSLLNICEDTVRLPLTIMTDCNASKLSKMMKELNII